jgi:hypothetical protein
MSTATKPKTLYVLGVVSHCQTAIKLSRELAQSFREATSAHHVNGPIADAIDDLLDQGLKTVPAVIDIRDVAAYDYDVIERGNTRYFVGDDLDNEVLVRCARLCAESFILDLAHLDLETFPAGPELDETPLSERRIFEPGERIWDIQWEIEVTFIELRERPGMEPMFWVEDTTGAFLEPGTQYGLAPKFFRELSGPSA